LIETGQTEDVRIASQTGLRYDKSALRDRDPPEVARPRTWLRSTGWRRHGQIDLQEVPGAA
jgi:hypothetical protein